MQIEHLQINHLIHPIVDDDVEFSYYLSSDERDVAQVSYHFIVKSDDEIFWDSGIVLSQQQSFIPYEGRKLESRKIYQVELSVEDNHGHYANTCTSFETTLTKDDWQAKWIEAPFERNPHRMLSDGIENPVVRFKKQFTLEKRCKSARLYATALGVYQVFINDKRPDQREFAPEFTSYGSQLYFQSYDVTALLQTGCNIIRFDVGDGWLFDSQTVPVKTAYEKPAVLYQLEITLQDNKTITIISDEQDQCCQSNILYSDLFVGEKVDYTKPNGPDCIVNIKEYGTDFLCAQKLDPVMPIETFKPVRLIKNHLHETIIDFGQVIAGRCRIHLHEKKGTEVRIHHTEALNPDNTYFSALTSRQREIIICDGSDFIYEPKFTFHGFRYIKIEGIEKVSINDFEAVLYSSEKENAGSFVCDNDEFNRLYQNIRYSQKNNTLSIPTDCPQREKAGWCGDVLVYCETSLLNEKMTAFYNSYLNNIAKDQYDNGAVPIIVPITKMYDMMLKKMNAELGSGISHTTVDDLLGEVKDNGNSTNSVAGWSDVAIWLPYSMYWVNGDQNVLEKYYSMMKKFVNQLINTADSERGDCDNDNDHFLFNTGFHFGEWLVPQRSKPGFDSCPETSWYVAPIFAYESIKRFAEIAGILKQKNDEKYYRTIAEKMKKAIQQEILPLQHPYNDYMGRYILALQFDLCDAKLKPAYEKRLIELIEKNGGKLQTGFLATPFILDVLDRAGRGGLAKGILFNRDCPSWLYEVKKGATTIWENWDAVLENDQPQKTSFDHYAFGVVDSYLFHKVCGIVNDRPGFKHFIVNPDLTFGFKFFKRVFNSEYGEISVEYKNDQLKVKIPCNTTATICFNGTKREVGSGEYYFK